MNWASPRKGAGLVLVAQLEVAFRTAASRDLEHGRDRR